MGSSLPVGHLVAIERYGADPRGLPLLDPAGIGCAGWNCPGGSAVRGPHDVTYRWAVGGIEEARWPKLRYRVAGSTGTYTHDGVPALLQGLGDQRNNLGGMILRQKILGPVVAVQGM